MLLRLLLSFIFFFVAAAATAQDASNQATINDRLASSFEALVPMLRPSAVVTSDIVTVGDLFDHSGTSSEVPIFRAPEPGTRGSVSATDVLAAARRIGIDDIDLAGLSEVTVERRGVRVSQADVEQLVNEALNARLHADLGEESGSYDVAIFGEIADFTLGLEQANGLTVDLALLPTPRTPRFSAVLRNQRGEQILSIEGTADHRISVPVLGRALGRHDVVRASDLRMVRVAYARTVGSPTLVDRADIIGRAASRSLRAGAPLNPDDLTAPLLVERQELVTLVYRQGALALTMRARALDEGAQGQAIDVENLQSNRIVRGVVMGNGLVHVLGPMQDMAAAVPDMLALQTSDDQMNAGAAQ